MYISYDKRMLVISNLHYIIRYFDRCAHMHADKEAYMSMVIIGGHDRMVRQYKQICKEHQCKVKVFTQMSANMREQIGSPDVIVLFTNTVSHKMVRVAVSEAGNADIIRCHTSSSNALQEIFENIERAKEA